jgi:stage II sporulation protein D
LIRTLLAFFFTVLVLQGEIVYKVRLSAVEGGRIVEMPVEQYVAAVLAGESATFADEEALKAMAVAARTYAAYFRSRHSAEGYDFCATTHCQRLVLKDAGMRFQKAAQATQGQLLWFGAKPVFAVYTRSCGGKSEAARNLWPGEQAPYLAAHDDPYCTRRNQQAWQWQVDPQTLSRSLTQAGMQVPAALSRVTVLERDSSGRVRTLLLNGAGSSQFISGSSFRFAVGRTLGWNTIQSDAYQVKSSGTFIWFEGQGKGHGAGLCQEGAQEMAAEGKMYREILLFYYPGASVSTLANDLKWTSVQDGSATVFAADAQTARKAAAMVNEKVNDLHSRYRLQTPSGLQVYVYPDLESYRNGTGEPGWVAAHTIGRRIETQPWTVLQQHGGFSTVIGHELLHAMVEAEAKPGLPLWFREGLVECLAGERANSPATPRSSTVADQEIGRRENKQSAQDAYRNAAQRVAELKSRYGVSELLRWVKEGMPEAEIRSSSSRQPTNSR